MSGSMEERARVAKFYATFSRGDQPELGTCWRRLSSQYAVGDGVRSLLVRIFYSMFSIEFC